MENTHAHNFPVIVGMTALPMSGICQSVINTEEIPVDTDRVFIAQDMMEFKSTRILRNITHGVNIVPVIDTA